MLSHPTLHDESPVPVIYVSLSLMLQTFLSIAIIVRLFEYESQTTSLVGKARVGRYYFLFITFIESAVINAMCSLVLVTASFPTRSRYGSWKDFADKSYKSFMAITPAIQVCMHYT